MRRRLRTIHSRARKSASRTTPMMASTYLGAGRLQEGRRCTMKVMVTRSKTRSHSGSDARPGCRPRRVPPGAAFSGSADSSIPISRTGARPSSLDAARQSHYSRMRNQETDECPKATGSPMSPSPIPSSTSSMPPRSARSVQEVWRERSWRAVAPSTRWKGEGRPRNVVIEFPSLQAALDCYNSPEYQAAKAKRAGAGVAEIVLVEGV